jgi:hypothetical protein
MRCLGRYAVPAMGDRGCSSFGERADDSVGLNARIESWGGKCRALLGVYFRNRIDRRTSVERAVFLSYRVS